MDTLIPPTIRTRPLTIQLQEMRQVLGSANRRGMLALVPGKVLKACPDQLSVVFMNIFNSSLAHPIMPEVCHHHPCTEEPTPDSRND